MKLGMVSFHVTNMLVKKLAAFGQVFGISFLQIGASLKKACGFERERVTFVCETTYAAPLLIFFTIAW